jgi:putative endonuclease
MKLTRNKVIGNSGEIIARDYLISLGYEILENNWHFSKNSEVDIIAKDKNTLVFVEVKTRSSLNYGHPLEAISQKKIQKIHMAAMAYLEQTKIKYDNYRIDVISIVGLKDSEIEHLKNIGLDF